MTFSSWMTFSFMDDFYFLYRHVCRFIGQSRQGLDRENRPIRKSLVRTWMTFSFRMSFTVRDITGYGLMD